MTQVLAVVGPTASGKTGVAVAVAEALGTEIISADSMQFYRGMEIGTGAPSDEELARVRHHFVGHLSPSEEMSAAEFQEAARGVVAELNARGKVAVVVGGSGLYIQALIDGLFEGPGKDAGIRERLEGEAADIGSAKLHERLMGIDAEYGARVEPEDLRRIVRALEVYELTGRPISELHREHRAATPSLDAVQVALDWPREALYARIEARVDTMLEAGLVDEVRGLVEAGHDSDIERLKSLGYREILGFVQGKEPLDEAVELMKMYTRRYAKRQLTWFRGDSRVEWLDGGGVETAAFHTEQVLGLLEK